MSIPPRFMAELRDRLTLSDLIGRKVKLVRAGREYKGCCPFHKEKSPSFYINDDKQFYHCFGCGAHGDAVEFVMQHDNLSFIEAVEMLAAQAGMAVPQQSPQDVERSRQEKSLHSLLDDTATFFSTSLRTTREGAEALQYLTGRGVSEEMIEAFRLGFAPSDGQAVRKYLAERGYTEAQMMEAGVLRASDRGREAYSFFRDRIMFPVADRRGRIVAFGGRVLPEHLRPLAPGASKPPKYINSSDTTLFHKGTLLYSESRARQAAAEGKPVVVVEGYVDVMACFNAGYAGAVAPLGTALTEEQIIALWKLIPDAPKTPILCFDGDAAGRRAAARACERILPLLKPDHSALFAFLPEGQDPDSLLRTDGRKAFEAVLGAALPLADFLWAHHTAGRRFDTPEQKAGLSKALDDDIARIADRTVQQYYRQAFRDRLYNLTRPPARQQGGKGKRPFSGQPSSPITPLRVIKPAFEENTLRSLILLAAVVNHPGIFESVEENLAALHLPQERLDLLRQAVLNLLGADPTLDRQQLSHHLTQKGYGEELPLVLSERIYTHAGFARPEADAGKVLSAWQETWRFMQNKAAEKELKDAGQALAHDFSPENEQKWMALHDVHKRQGEEGL